MTFEPKDIKEIGSLQEIIEGLRIEDILDSKFIEFLQKKYSDKYDIRASELAILLLSKPVKKTLTSKKLKNGEKLGITIALDTLNFLKLTHRNEEDYIKKIVVLTSPSKDIINKFVVKE